MGTQGRVQGRQYSTSVLDQTGLAHPGCLKDQGGVLRAGRSSMAAGHFVPYRLGKAVHAFNSVPF